MTVGRPLEKREPVAAGGTLERVETRHDLRNRVIPGNSFISTVAALAGALERLGDPIGVVRHLDRRLAAWAQAALIDRVCRAAFEFLGRVDAHPPCLTAANDLGIGIHDPHGQAASRCAERAHARLPNGHARNDVIVGNEANELVLRVAAAGERRTRCGHGCELDEGTSIHVS